jgi:PAS domain S-box-containing protein
LAQAGGIVAAGFGFLALLGWTLPIPLLASLGPEFIPMAPSTALLFVVLGLATFWRARRPRSRAVQRWSAIVGIAGALVSLALAILSVQGIYLEVEHVGLPITGALNGVPLGHMSPVTALSFLLVSVSFLASRPSDRERTGRLIAAFALAAVVCLANYVFVLAYFVGLPLLYGGTLIPPALPTSLTFLALGLSLAASAQHQTRQPGRPGDATPARLANTFLLVFAALALTIVTVGYLYYRNYENQYRREVERQLSAIADLKVSELTQWRKERLGDGETFYDNPVFSQLVQRAFEDPPDAISRKQLQWWLNRVREAYHYDRVSLLDAHNIERLVTPGEPEPIAPDLANDIAAVLQSRQVTLLDFHRHPPDQAIHLAVLAPVLDPQDRNRAIGVVILRIDPRQYLYPLINRWPTPSETAETLLVRRDGNDVLFLNELRFQPNAALQLRFPLANAALPAAKAARGETGVAEGVDYRGAPVLADMRAVPDSPWYLVTRMDISEVYAPLQARLVEMAVLVSVMVLGAGAGVALVWRQQRVRFYKERYEIERERAWLQEVMERSLNEIYVFDAQSLHFIYANTGACRNLGYSPQELAGLTPLDIKPEMTPATFEALLQPLRSAQSELTVFETIHRRKDGSEYPVEVHLQYVTARGNPVFLAIINDITERRQAEKQIKKLNRVYAVLSDINQAIVRIRDPQTLLGQACQIAVEQGGFRLAWIGLVDDATGRLQVAARAGQSDSYLDTLSHSLTDEPLSRCPIDLALRTGRHMICNLLVDDGRLSGCQQSVFALGIRSTASFPLKVAGAVRGTLNLYSPDPGYFDEDEIKLLDELAQDLTFALEFAERDLERRHAEDALRESEAFTRIVLDNLPLGIAVNSVSPTITFSYMNDNFPRLYRTTKEKLAEPDTFWNAVYEDPDFRAAIRQRVLDDTASGDPERLIWTDIPITRAGEETTYITARNIPIPDRALMISTVWDVTARKRAEDALRQLNAELEQRVARRTAQLEAANRELEAFAYSVSHDLRAPLRAIDGFSRILQEDYGDRLDAEGQRLFGIVRSNAQKMDQLITDLLALSRVTRSDLIRQRLDMTALARAVYDDLADPAVQAQFTFTLAPLPEATGDPTLLRLVWGNLISNAIKYTRPKADRRIEIGGYRQGNEHIYFVKDTGVGFNPDYAHKLFGVFQRLHKAEDFEGTGVGLAIVQRIVQRHGGRVWADGQLDRGATFYFSLPRHEADHDQSV